MAPSFQSKIRPVASTTAGTPSFASKIRQKVPVVQPSQPPKKDFLQKTGDIVNAIFPGKQVGTAIGALAGLGISKAQGTSEFYDTSAPTPLQTLADTAQGALFLAGGELGGLSKGARIGGGALLGAGFGGTGAIAEGKKSKDVLKETAIGGAVGGIGTGLIEGGLGALSFLKGSLGKKTVQQVLNTAEKDLGKLSEAERAIYYANKTREITTKTTTEKIAVARATQQQITNLQNEGKVLSEELGKASRDEVLRLRPKIISAMGRQSQTYRSLVEKDLENFKNVKVSSKELSDFIMNKYRDNPQVATEVLSKFSFKEPNLLNPNPTVSVPELYQQAVSLGKEIGTAARKGGRVFTAEEKMTDDAISTMVDFIKSKGADLSNARQFWAEWAPVRNQLVTEAKPFIQSDTLTGTFANRLVRFAKGKDINSANYIDEIEKLVGPVGKDIKAVVQKLDVNQKQMLAVKLEAQAKREGIQLSTQEARTALGEVKAKSELSADHRKRIIQLIKGILLTAGVGYGIVRGSEYIGGF